MIAWFLLNIAACAFIMWKPYKPRPGQGNEETH